MTEELPLLIEKYRKEIWEWKQRESQWIKDKNQLDGHKRIVEEVSNELVRMKKRLQELEGNRSLDTMDEVAYRELQREVRVKELNNSLAIALEVNDSHQRYNGKLQTRLTEVEEDNKKISRQIEDKINLLKKAGL
jgi:hypothetical protein